MSVSVMGETMKLKVGRLVSLEKTVTKVICEEGERMGKFLMREGKVDVSVHSGRTSKMAINLTIRHAQQRVDEYLKVKGEKWTKLSNHYLRVTHLVEEVGELARAVINLDAEYGDPNRRGFADSREEKLALVQDSLGDILYHLFAISISYGLDLESAFDGSMRSITRRYSIPAGASE